MQAGLHAIGWGLQRLAIAAGVTVFAALLAYSALVFVIGRRASRDDLWAVGESEPSTADPAALGVASRR
jgi:hypothetical protein